jgi:hypothetical protein
MKWFSFFFYNIKEIERERDWEYRKGEYKVDKSLKEFK